jgi:catechol 2,3-dioxygenase-like lactoylglutathione lyase family enzyme
MAKLRHVAMSVPDPDAAADFYCEAFDMKRVGERDSSLAKGVFVSDGVITMALLKFKSDAQGDQRLECGRAKSDPFIAHHHGGSTNESGDRTICRRMSRHPEE